MSFLIKKNDNSLHTMQQCSKNEYVRSWDLILGWQTENCVGLFKWIPQINFLGIRKMETKSLNSFFVLLSILSFTWHNVCYNENWMNQ